MYLLIISSSCSSKSGISFSNVLILLFPFRVDPRINSCVVVQNTSKFVLQVDRLHATLLAFRPPIHRCSLRVMACVPCRITNDVDVDSVGDESLGNLKNIDSRPNIFVDETISDEAGIDIDDRGDGFVALRIGSIGDVVEELKELW